MTKGPGFDDVLDAAARLAGQVVRTPLVESPKLNALAGGRLLVKAEMLQRTGSFKFRGAYNHMSRLDADQRRRGVVAYSSGNHAQAVAAVARLLGMPAVIVMPSDAPAIKIANTRAYGAEVVPYDRLRDNREAIGEALAAARGLALVRPYDDPLVVAGQGTVGLELAEQAAELGTTLDAVLVPCGGGGLVAGVALALSGRSPATRVYAVEPQGFDDTALSLAAGRRVGHGAGDASFCDALMAPMPGEITFPIHRRLLAGGLAVGDDDTARAMAAAFLRLKLVVEPGGAVALAAVLAGKLPVTGGTVAVVCSGGNVDPAVFCRALAQGVPAA